MFFIHQALIVVKTGYINRLFDEKLTFRKKQRTFAPCYSTPPLVECTSYSVAAIPRTHDAGHSLSGPWESPHFSSALLQRSQIECPRALSLVMGIRRSHREQDWGCKAVMLNLARNCMTWGCALSWWSLHPARSSCDHFFAMWFYNLANTDV